jgi:hypothetical protein
MIFYFFYQAFNGKTTRHRLRSFETTIPAAAILKSCAAFLVRVMQRVASLTKVWWLHEDYRGGTF